MLGSFPLILIVKASSSIQSVSDLVAFAKQNPEKANYSSASPAFQLVTELFKKETGAPMQRVSYKGANDAVLAVISGDVTAAIADAGPVMAQVSGGVVRALAVAAPNRVGFLPGVPTMKEAGANVEAVLWSGVFAPKATPETVVTLLADEFMKIAREGEVVQRLGEIGIDAVGSSSADFATTVSSDLEKWAAAANAAGLQRMEQ
jgi:tripartite-type tricarboxylate transporter receptor subunit TctC